MVSVEMSNLDSFSTMHTTGLSCTVYAQSTSLTDIQTDGQILVAIGEKDKLWEYMRNAMYSNVHSAYLAATPLSSY